MPDEQYSTVKIPRQFSPRLARKLYRALCLVIVRKNHHREMVSLQRLMIAGLSNRIKLATVLAVAEDMTCKHQFFETNKPVRHRSSCDHKGLPIDVYCLNDEHGNQVMCALCGERKILWQDGAIEVLKTS